MKRNIENPLQLNWRKINGLA